MIIFTYKMAQKRRLRFLPPVPVPPQPRTVRQPPTAALRIVPLLALLLVSKSRIGYRALSSVQRWRGSLHETECQIETRHTSVRDGFSLICLKEFSSVQLLLLT
jgi:hypothetical protein